MKKLKTQVQEDLFYVKMLAYVQNKQTYHSLPWLAAEGRTCLTGKVLF